MSGTAVQAETKEGKAEGSVPAAVSVSGFLRRVIFVYLRAYGRPYALIILSILLALSFELYVSLSYGPLLDDAIPNHDGRKMALVLGAIGVLFLLSSLGDTLRDYLCSRVGRQVVDDLRLALFRRLQALPAGFYIRAQTSDILTRFANDVFAIEGALAEWAPYGLFALLRTMANAILLFIVNWRLALIMACVLPLTFLLPQRFTNRAAKTGEQRKEDDMAVLNTVQEHLGAQATTRAFGLHDTAISTLVRQLASLAGNAFTARFQQRLVTRSSDIGQWFVFVLVLGLGSYQALRGELRVGMFMSFLAFLSAVGVAASALASFFSALIPAALSQRRIDELLREPVGVQDAADAVPLPRLARGPEGAPGHEIRFERVTFSYAGPGGEPNLREASFRIPAGQMVAFVGRSGSGKSTALNLLLRFYDPEEGRVLVEGRDLRQVTQASLHAQVGVVLQETFLFNTTVRDNIRLSKPEASDAEVEAAASLSEVHDFVMSLPQGYDTVVGERGGRLSGGQRQRIALARAILRDPAMLLLDEATSALDPETEAAINATLAKLARNRTVLSVTHRLASVAHMDQILVMDGGQLVEQGPHQELLARGGLYSQLWQQQNGFIVSGDGRQAEVTAPRLRAIPIFSTLDDATLEAIAERFRVERYDTDQVLVREGEPGDRLFIVVRGKVAMSTTGYRQKSVELPVLQDGDCFGELALLESVPQPYTARTLLPTLVLTLQREPFSQMMDDIPSLREAMEKVALTRSLRLVVARGRRRGARSPTSGLNALDALDVKGGSPKEGRPWMSMGDPQAAAQAPVASAHGAGERDNVPAPVIEPAAPAPVAEPTALIPTGQSHGRRAPALLWLVGLAVLLAGMLLGAAGWARFGLAPWLETRARGGHAAESTALRQAASIVRGTRLPTPSPEVPTTMAPTQQPSPLPSQTPWIIFVEASAVVVTPSPQPTNTPVPPGPGGAAMPTATSQGPTVTATPTRAQLQATSTPAPPTGRRVLLVASIRSPFAPAGPLTSEPAVIVPADQAVPVTITLKVNASLSAVPTKSTWEIGKPSTLEVLLFPRPATRSLQPITIEVLIDCPAMTPRSRLASTMVLGPEVDLSGSAMLIPLDLGFLPFNASAGTLPRLRVKIIWQGEPSAKTCLDVQIRAR
jgi:ATP-binding cassette subfamily B protein